MDDVRRTIYGTLIIFIIGVVGWVGFILFNACGTSYNCRTTTLQNDRTPIPTLIPATLPAIPSHSGEVRNSGPCLVAAIDLIGAWVEAGVPGEKPFRFTGLDGRNCEATFAEVLPIFLEADLWYPGSLPCVACHSKNLEISPAQLDLSDYEAILAGAGRTDSNSKGVDILGGGEWRKSKLYEYLVVIKPNIPGHDRQVSGLTMHAGIPRAPQIHTEIPNPTETPGIPSTP